MQSHWKLAYFELQASYSLKLLNRKQGPLSFYITSSKLETTLPPLLD